MFILLLFLGLVKVSEFVFRRQENFESFQGFVYAEEFLTV